MPILRHYVDRLPWREPKIRNLGGFWSLPIQFSDNHSEEQIGPNDSTQHQAEQDCEDDYAVSHLCVGMRNEILT